LIVVVNLVTAKQQPFLPPIPASHEQQQHAYHMHREMVVKVKVVETGGDLEVGQVWGETEKFLSWRGFVTQKRRCEQCVGIDFAMPR
jgi:hypothetical protein